MALQWLHWPQDVVDPDDVAFVWGFVVDGDGGGGLDPQVASSPLEPAVVAGHHLAFPQHWEETGWRVKRKGCGTGYGRLRGGKRRGQVLVWQFTMTAAEGADHNRTERRFNRLSSIHQAALKFRHFFGLKGGINLENYTSVYHTWVKVKISCIIITSVKMKVTHLNSCTWVKVLKYLNFNCMLISMDIF